MKYTQGNYRIVKKENLAKNCYDFTIACPEIAEIAQAGQFAHVKINGFSLRRPISICEVDKENGTIRIVFEIRGEGTKALADCNENTLIDIIAPLGNGFTLLDSSKKAIVIGGGIGVPPMVEVAKHYRKNATAIIGFRSANAVILNEDFDSLGANVMLCTDDGTMGQKGYVTTALATRLEQETADIIYACGPHLMLKGIIELANKYNIRCEVSLEERMGCGVGACLVCACKTVKDGKEYFAHVCKDGPVFDSKEVIL
ncbi:dihydroorotate dehydrogenase electron transfer subunit [Paludicola sp. MB14-C6]|uniref:dihydroorotate dehydrogenase electron transfer subunit n=1 Tax=Paludihabitans sp. MB14-C6 TaxID=3070656 RepID=UPI0027DE6EDA|nr:dihydroorotate dehydrogenase electron transfer subunit [Paludicola sp. MB14-C6]WMJ22547.1 dihydroorotate dehydrogenase electron transfer subunit [Paludicola sp. MB14-C6]